MRFAWPCVCGPCQMLMIVEIAGYAYAAPCERLGDAWRIIAEWSNWPAKTGGLRAASGKAVMAPPRRTVMEWLGARPPLARS